MNKLLNTFLFVTGIMTAPDFAYAQSDLKATVADLAFISGNWVTSMKWGDMEENWSAPVGNSMMCSYRCIKDGKVTFYEFIVIENSETAPVMKLHHFAPGNVAWEDKPYEYPLVSLQKNIAIFESSDKKEQMSFIRDSDETLKVILVQEDKQGVKQTHNFDFKLAKK
ncbi:MAG: DUF6265 family protein [Flammeovirgaceae bacterium]|nr:DUF6265 family protein [Flammeovirgaceae bacterium]